MAQIIWTEPAILDLNDIAEYIALDKISAAQKLVQKVFVKVKRLALFPESGKQPTELSDTRYQEMVVGPCRIFFRYESRSDKPFIPLAFPTMGSTVITLKSDKAIPPKSAQPRVKTHVWSSERAL